MNVREIQKSARDILDRIKKSDSIPKDIDDQIHDLRQALNSCKKTEERSSPRELRRKKTSSYSQWMSNRNTTMKKLVARCSTATTAQKTN